MNRREAARKAVHIGLGTGVYAVPLVGALPMAAVLFLAAVGNLLLLPRLRWTRWLLREESGGAHAGLVLYPLVLAVLFLLFRHDPRPAICGWLALALADGLAPILALALGGPPCPWGPSKRLGPSIVAAAVAAVAMRGWVPAEAAAAGGLGALLGESSTGRLDDNILCPSLAALGVFCVLTGA